MFESAGSINVYNTPVAIADTRNGQWTAGVTYAKNSSDVRNSEGHTLPNVAKVHTADNSMLKLQNDQRKNLLIMSNNDRNEQGSFKVDKKLKATTAASKLRPLNQRL